MKVPIIKVHFIMWVCIGHGQIILNLPFDKLNKPNHEILSYKLYVHQSLACCSLRNLLYLTTASVVVSSLSHP